MTIEVEITSDIACPWCYLGRTHLERAIEKIRESFGPSIAFNVHWKTFMIDTRTATGGEEYMAYNRRRWGGDGWTYELRSRGEKVGAKFAKWVWWPNTLRGHALEHYVLEHYGPAAQDNMTRILFQLTYEEGCNISEESGLLKACSMLSERMPDLHIDVPAMEQAVKSRACVDKAWEEDKESKSYGIDGVPFFRIFCPKVLPESRAITLGGCQPISGFVRAFERIINAAK